MTFASFRHAGQLRISNTATMARSLDLHDRRLFYTRRIHRWDEATGISVMILVTTSAFTVETHT